MSFLRLLFLAVLAIVLLILALANRDLVTLRLVPETFEGLIGSWQISLPLFAVIFVAIAVGLLVGFVWEWLREHKHRAEASRQRAAKERLEKQLTKAKGGSEEDEVLALLDSPRG